MQRSLHSQCHRNLYPYTLYLLRSDRRSLHLIVLLLLVVIVPALLSSPPPPTPLSKPFKALPRLYGGRCAPPSSAEGCWVTSYSELGSVEASFYWGTLLAGVEGACGCRVELRQRAAFVGDLQAGTIGCAAILQAVKEVSEKEEEAMRAHAATTRVRVVVVHMSDEREDFSVSAYGLPRAVFRNYAATRDDRVADLAYLAAGGGGRGKGGGGPLWLPLGYGEAFLPGLAPALSHPTRARPLAWSWSGSTTGKPQRIAFLEGVRRYEQVDLLAVGALHEFAGFYDTRAALRPAEYSGWLYLSRTAPCPDGGSAEQFRVWEALAAGAVPIVSAEHPHLQYLGALGFQVLLVQRWAEEAGALLHAAAFNSTFVAELERMQAGNTRALKRTLQAAQLRFAAEVCGAALGLVTDPASE